MVNSPNLFWAGLSVLASKNFDRDLLVVGSHEVKYRINGSNSAGNFSEKISGELIVSPPQIRANNQKPGIEDLVSSLLYRLSKTKRSQLIQLIASEGMVFDNDAANLAKELIKALTIPSTTLVRGSLAFQAS